VVPYAPGGPVDLSARLIAPKLQQALGQPLVVENKPGAGGNIGADFVAKSAPDGYTLVLGAIATHAINPALYASLPYDPVRDRTCLRASWPTWWRWRSASPASSTSPPAPQARPATSRANSSSS
jgi:tripartite-type tricarboxylate transporter receptor subunit TctC